MVTKALLAKLKAKPGKEKEVAEFLKSAVPLVNAEDKTIAWFAIQWDESTFGIFDVFEDESGRDAHLKGEVAKALMAKAPDLFSENPDIQKIDVLAEKM